MKALSRNQFSLFKKGGLTRITIFYEERLILLVNIANIFKVKSQNWTGNWQVLLCVCLFVCLPGCQSVSIIPLPFLSDVCTHINTYVSMYVYLSMYVHLLIYVCISTYLCLSIYLYSYMYIYLSFYQPFYQFIFNLSI